MYTRCWPEIVITDCYVPWTFSKSGYRIYACDSDDDADRSMLHYPQPPLSSSAAAYTNTNPLMVLQHPTTTLMRNPQLRVGDMAVICRSDLS